MRFFPVDQRFFHVRRSSPRRRHGGIFLESTMAIVIAATALVGVAQILALAAHQRRAAEYRLLATHEAGNLMEDLMTRPWTQLTRELLEKEQLSAPCRERLPGGRLDVEIAAEGEASAALKIAIAIDWEVAANQRCSPVRLVAWRYNPREAAP